MSEDRWLLMKKAPPRLRWLLDGWVFGPLHIPATMPAKDAPLRPSERASIEESLQREMAPILASIAKAQARLGLAFR